MNDSWSISTLGIRAHEPRSAEQEHSAALHLTSSFVFRSAEEAAAVFAGTQPGNIYSRFTNPTVQAFEKRLAALEGGDSCVATASGMSAVLSMVMALLKAGDHIVASQTMFGSTISLLTNIFSRFNIDTTFVDSVNPSAWRAALRPNTRLLFAETPSNPLTDLVDIAVVAEIARDHGCLFAVDNCFLTPALQRPLALGAHLVIHSATKYLDGQGRCVGGAIVGDHKRVGEDVFSFMRTAGPCMSPFNAWVFLKGLETLHLRMTAQSRSAETLARWLQAQPQVKRVFYSGLETHPQHALAKRQQSGFGAVLAFEVFGGRAAAWRLINRLQLLSITANLGDTRSTITHPATTTHGRISTTARAAAGISDELLRIAVGLEDPVDLMADLEQGMRAG
jgi:O-succinylhomoserine sulfhydrylase